MLERWIVGFAVDVGGGGSGALQLMLVAVDWGLCS
jgi:hypothetical protein